MDVANILSGFDDVEIEKDAVEEEPEETAVPEEAIDAMLPSKVDTQRTYTNTVG